MKRVLFAFIIVTLSFRALPAAVPQSVLEGTVSEESGDGLGFATVALYRDSVLVSGSTADKDGRYTLKAPSGKYTLTASLIGYLDGSVAIELTSGTVKAPDLTLKPDVVALKGAKVTEGVKTVEMKLDKMIVNVSQSSFAQSTNALELLKKSPGVVVDKDGNVSLNGKSVAIWIDGRPSHLDGKSLEALLKGTQGNTIDKFELMEHPSSKYDAAGAGGIINIKTKKNLLSGLNGSVGIDGGGMYFPDIERGIFGENAFANLAYRTSKTNTFVNLSQDMDYGHLKTYSSTKLGEDGELLSVNIPGVGENYWQAKVGNDWFIDSKNTLGVILSANGGKVTQNSSRADNKSTTTVGGEEIASEESESGNDSKGLRLNANLNYTHVFDPTRNAEITANLDYFHNSRSSAENQTIWTVKPAGGDPDIRTIDGSSDIDIYSAKADYQSVLWGNTMFEAGAKWAMTNTRNSTSRTGSGFPDPVTEFTYREHIAALYFDFARQLGQKWSIKAGLRGEYTNTRGDWSSRPDEPTLRSYFNLFPTVFVGFNPSMKQRYSISYTRRINRPGYYSMNPTEEYYDVHNYLKGNPDILPSFNHDLSLQAGFGKHASVSAGYSYQKDIQTQVPHYTESGDQCLEWGNFGKQHMIYLAASAMSVPIAKWLEWTAFARGMFVNSNSGMFESKSISGFVYTCFTFVLPKDWKIEWDGNIMSPMQWGYFKTKTSLNSDLGVKKTMLDGKLNLSINLNDIFRTSRMDMDIVDPQTGKVQSYLGQKYYFQGLRIGLTWNFGKSSATPARKVGILDEASRTSGGSGAGIGK